MAYELRESSLLAVRKGVAFDRQYLMEVKNFGPDASSTGTLNFFGGRFTDGDDAESCLRRRLNVELPRFAERLMSSAVLIGQALTPDPERKALYDRHIFVADIPEPEFDQMFEALLRDGVTGDGASVDLIDEFTLREFIHMGDGSKLYKLLGLSLWELETEFFGA